MDWFVGDITESGDRGGDWISNGSEVIEGSQKDPVCRSWAGGEGGGRGVDQEGGVAGQAH